jgi:hypothetical protein
MNGKFNGRAEDYIYCKDCGILVDLWKFSNLDDTGHGQCSWRFVTKAEFEQCVKDCKEDGCFEEVFL